LSRQHADRTAGSGYDSIGNVTLRRVVVGTAIASALALIVPALLPPGWREPGSPLLQGAAIAGSVLLLLAFATVHGKRLAKPGRRGLDLHIWLAAVGLPLVAAHSTGSFLRPPALLLGALAALVGLGWWARTEGGRRMAATFGTKRAGFMKPEPTLSLRLAGLIEHKQDILRRLEPTADEALFSPTFSHWRRAPLLTWAYQRAVDSEYRLLGARGSVGAAQAYWRVVHQLLAWGFVLGLGVHVVLVLLFAGYVAEGGDIYWWRFADWDF